MKISKVLDILFIELKTRVRMLKVLSWAFVVLTCRSTSLESGLASPLEFSLFVKDSPSSTMSSVKLKSVIFSPGYRCDHRGTIVKPQSSTVTCRKGAKMSTYRTATLISNHLTFRGLRELMTWCHIKEHRILYKLCLEPRNGEV